MAKASASTPQPATPIMTDKEMVRQILDSGVTKPADVFEAVKTKFGKEVSKGNINQIKNGWTKEQREAAGTPAAAAPTPKPSTTKPAGGGSFVDNSSAKSANISGMSEAEISFMLVESFGLTTAKAIVAKLQGHELNG